MPHTCILTYVCLRNLRLACVLLYHRYRFGCILKTRYRYRYRYGTHRLASSRAFWAASVSCACCETCMYAHRHTSEIVHAHTRVWVCGYAWARVHTQTHIDTPAAVSCACCETYMYAHVRVMCVCVTLTTDSHTHTHTQTHTHTHTYTTQRDTHPHTHTHLHTPWPWQTRQRQICCS